MVRLNWYRVTFQMVAVLRLLTEWLVFGRICESILWDRVSLFVSQRITVQTYCSERWRALPQLNHARI